MPSTHVADLSELQLAIMGVLWDRREATSSDVQRALHRSRGLAITTVSTLLSRLEKRGVVTHRAEGRTFVYRAAVSEHEVRRSMLAGIVHGLFRGDVSEVVSQLLSAREVDHGDLERIEELISAAKRAAVPARGAAPAQGRNRAR
jgi:BlaI family penicillinase repressor